MLSNKLRHDQNHNRHRQLTDRRRRLVVQEIVLRLVHHLQHVVAGGQILAGCELEEKCNAIL